jgi:hypothetical protein
MLYNVRFEIAMSEMMEYNIANNNLKYDLISEFKKEDPDNTGTITVN